MADFNAGLDKLLLAEGGKSNNPMDKGKKTNLGITQRALDQFKLDWPHGGMPTDVDTLTREDVSIFYRIEYWVNLKLTQINSQILANTIFNFAVNCGAGTVAKKMQHILGLTEDGIIGPITIAKINALDSILLNNLLCNEMQTYYDAIVENDPTQSVFANGWKNRVNKNRVA